MRILIVEDDLACRQLLLRWLIEHGECDVAADGIKALVAFEAAFSQECPYDLICLDIMMPDMDGHQTLKTIRDIEYVRGIRSADAVKIIMTSALKSSHDIIKSFRCDAYLTGQCDVLYPILSILLVVLFLPFQLTEFS